MLWLKWYEAVKELKGSCSRNRTFIWVVLALVGFSARSDFFGVTSFVRTGFIKERHYHSLLNMFHSKAIKLEVLTSLWVKLAVKLFSPVYSNGYVVMIADGIKIPKEGRKMPAVKSLHQESESNSKPAYIMGHSFQAISLLVKGFSSQYFAVPLISRITEGVLFSNADKKTLLDKLILMLNEIIGYSVLDCSVLLIADAYYAKRTIILPLLKKGNQLITRAASNIVAYEPVAAPKIRKRGRPATYGKKVKLKELFADSDLFTSAKSTLYGDRDNIIIKYQSLDLMWKPLGFKVRFVLVIHPVRGRIILMSTDLKITPLEVVRLYSLRFKIEVSFKQAVHTLGTYTYRFWMGKMKKTKTGEGNQHLHKKSKKNKDAVRRKIKAYHVYVQLGCIAQGLLMHLAVNQHKAVWKTFRSWLRTMNPDLIPSEMVVAMALRSSLPEFLLTGQYDSSLTKIIMDKAEPDRMPSFLRCV